MRPSHRAKDPIVAALDREVDVLTQPGAVRIDPAPEQLDQRRVDLVGIDGAKPQARPWVIAQQPRE
jgi:hypothetical protein